MKLDGEDMTTMAERINASGCQRIYVKGWGSGITKADWSAFAAAAKNQDQKVNQRQAICNEIERTIRAAKNFNFESNILIVDGDFIMADRFTDLLSCLVKILAPKFVVAVRQVKQKDNDKFEAARTYDNYHKGIFAGLSDLNGNNLEVPKLYLCFPKTKENGDYAQHGINIRQTFGSGCLLCFGGGAIVEQEIKTSWHQQQQKQDSVIFWNIQRKGGAETSNLPAIIGQNKDKWQSVTYY